VLAIVAERSHDRAVSVSASEVQVTTNKSQRAIERRALALAPRELEREGICPPPRDLAELAASRSDDEIDHEFDLFVSVDGSTLGGTRTLEAIHEAWAAELIESGLIATPASREFTEQRHRLNERFTEYAAPHRKWKAVVFEDAASEDLPR
jgi:hypothetical protein